MKSILKNSKQNFDSIESSDSESNIKNTELDKLYGNIDENEPEEIDEEQLAELEREEEIYNNMLIQKFASKQKDLDNSFFISEKPIIKKEVNNCNQPKSYSKVVNNIPIPVKEKPEFRQFNPRLPIPNKFNIDHKKQFKLNNLEFPQL
jgi:hypothetical protein